LKSLGTAASRTAHPTPPDPCRAAPGKAAEAVVRTPLKELLDQLDAEQFAQVHRSVVVNLRAITHVKRHDNETAEIHLKGRDDVLPVSRNYVHLFRQM
jgi:DNA-binding LytR/AlgR family response regulator